MIGTKLQSFISSHKDTNGSRSLVLQYFYVSSSTFFEFGGSFIGVISIQFGSPANTVINTFINTTINTSISMSFAHNLMSSSSFSSKVWTWTRGNSTMGSKWMSGLEGGAPPSEVLLSLPSSSCSGGGDLFSLSCNWIQNNFVKRKILSLCIQSNLCFTHCFIVK